MREMEGEGLFGDAPSRDLLQTNSTHFISIKGRRRSSSSPWNHLKQFKAVGTGVLGVPEFQNNSTYKLKGRISINFHSVRNFLNLESFIGGSPKHPLGATGGQGEPSQSSNQPGDSVQSL